MIAAARVEPLLAAIFGSEPRGVTYRRTFDVLSVMGYIRDEDALDVRTKRAMVQKP